MAIVLYEVQMVTEKSGYIGIRCGDIRGEIRGGPSYHAPIRWSVSELYFCRDHFRENPRRSGPNRPIVFLVLGSGSHA